MLLPNSLIRAKNLFVKNGTANFGRNIPTETCGPPPEVIPNIPVRRNRNEPFHLNSDRNFRNLWHDGKHPIFIFFKNTPPLPGFVPERLSPRPSRSHDFGDVPRVPGLRYPQRLIAAKYRGPGTRQSVNQDRMPIL